jgi:hypothetical protein
MDDNRGRQLLHVAGEPSRVGERLEQQAEAQTHRTGLVSQELELVGAKRPMLDQLIPLRPLSLDGESPSVGTEWTRSVPSNVLTGALRSGWGGGFRKVPRMTSVGTYWLSTPVLLPRFEQSGRS